MEEKKPSNNLNDTDLKAPRINGAGFGAKSFFSYFKKPIFSSKLIIWLVVILAVLLVIAGIFFIIDRIKKSSLVPDSKIITKQVSGAGANYKPIKWVKIVKLSELKKRQKYLTLPKEATNLSIKKINNKQALAYLEAPPKTLAFKTEERQVLARVFSSQLVKDATKLATGPRGLIPRVIFDVESIILEAASPAEEATQKIDISEFVDSGPSIAVEETAPQEPPTQEATPPAAEESLPSPDKQKEADSEEKQAEASPEKDKSVKDKEDKKDEADKEESIAPPPPSEQPTPQPEPPPSAPVGETPPSQEEPVASQPSSPEGGGGQEEIIDHPTEAVLETPPSLPAEQTLREPVEEPTENVPEETPLEEDLLLVEYETPSPTISEETTSEGKLVTVHDPVNDPKNPLVNVLAYTTIPEIFKVGQEDKIQVKWKNEGDQLVEFRAYDLDKNGYLDYIEWTVPHLSEQVFEIIFISKAFHLDENKKILADIYDQVRYHDNNWSTIANNQYVRVTFEKILTNQNDITLYARSSSGVTIEVYPFYPDGSKDSQLIATFQQINQEAFYKVLLTNLQTATDVFDLKVIAGSDPAMTGGVDIDYIVDANRYWVGSAGGNTNDTANWASADPASCTGGGASVPGPADIAIFDADCDNNATINANFDVIGIDIRAGYIGTVTQAAGITLTVGTSNYLQADGTFTGGNSTIDINGGFTLSGGTFTTTSGRLEVSGAFNRSGGTFTHNSGTVLLNASANQTLTNTQNFNNLVINDGLVGYWKLDETSGTSAADSSGYGNTGTHTGGPTISTTVPTVNFTNPRSLDFDGVNDYVDVGNLSVTGGITIALWVRPDDPPATTDFQMFVAKRNDNLTNKASYELDKATSSDELRFTFNVAGTWQVWTTTNLNLTQNEWQHIAVTYNESNHPSFYRNGTAASHDSGGTPQALPTNTAATRIGTFDATNFMFDGLIDDVRVYNRALSATEITSFYAGTQPANSSVTQTLGGALTVAGNLTLNAGTLDVSSASNYGITVTGNWENNGGVLTPRTGTVTLNGTDADNTILSGGQRFNNLTVSGSGGTYTLSDRLNASSTLAVSAGTLDARSGGNYNIHVGTINQTGGTITPRSGTVIADATNNQTLTVTSALNNLRIEDASENGLVGYWKFDEGNTTSARDSSGNANTGTLTNNPTWSTTVNSTTAYDNPYSLSFDGTNDYVDIGLPLSTVSDITMCVWFKRAAGNSTIEMMVTWDNDVNPFAVLDMRTNGIINLGFRDAGNDILQIVSPLEYDDGSWHLACGTKTGGNTELFIDGASVATGFNALLGDVAGVGVNWNIGRRASGNLFFPGQLDDVRIYNRALSATEVANLAAGRYADGATGTATYTLGGNTTVSGTLTLDSGILANSSFTNTVTNLFTLAGGNGTYTAGSGTNTFNGGLTVLGGTFTGGSGAIDINGTYTLSGGTFTSTSGTLTIFHDTGASVTLFNQSGGTFTHNSGTVILKGGLSTNCGGGFFTHTIDVNTTITFNHLTFDNTGCSSSTAQLAFATAFGDTLVVNGDLTHNAQGLNSAITLKGNLIVGAKAQGVANSEGASGSNAITLDGIGDKTYTHASGGITSAVTINKSSGTVTPASGTTTFGTSTFTLTQGSFTAPTGAFTIRRASNSSVTVFSVASGTTFTHNSGTLTLNPSAYSTNCGASAGQTLDVPTSLSVGSFTLNSDCNSEFSVTTASGDTIIATGAFTHTNGALNGTWEGQGAVTIGSGADGGTASFTFTGTSNQTYTDNGGDEPNGDITINKTAGAVTLASAADWNATGQDVTITDGTLDLAGFNLSTGVLTVTDALTMQGGETITRSSLSFASGSTATYNGTGSYTTALAAGNTYSNLTFNGSGGSWQHDATLDVNSNLTLTAGTLNSSGQNITLAGNWDNTNGSYTSGTNTVTLDGSGAQTVTTGGVTDSKDFNNFTVNKSGGTASVTGDLDVDGTFTLTAGTFTAPSGTLYVSANFTHTAGTFTHNSGTVNLDGTNQTLSGASTFNNLTKSVTVAATLTFPSGASNTQTIAGTMTLNGAAGQLLSLRSNITDTQWKIDPQGTRTISYLDVKDSNNINATAITTAGLNITDSGNNTNWTFNVAPSITAGPSDGGSSTTTPTAAGSNVTFTATASDTNGDNYYLAVCKTNSVTANNIAAPTCGGGNWCISSSTASSSQASCNYASVAGDSESNAWYAFVCDHSSASSCSSSLQGSGDNGSPFKVNHVPSFSALSVTGSDFGAGASVPFNATASDTDTDSSADTVTLYVCKASDFTGTACGSAGQWCNSSASSSDPTCSYTVLVGDGNGTHNYFTYIVDNHNLAAADNPRSGSFTTLTVATSPSIISSGSVALLTIPEVIQRITDLPGQFRDLIVIPPEVVLPPAEEFVTEETPEALIGKWNLLTPNSVKEFVLAPLPGNLNNLIRKFPRFGVTLKELGIKKITELEKLRAVKFNLPGFAETAGLGQVAYLSELTEANREKIPAEFIFARLSNTTLDISSKVSLDDKGNIEYSIEVPQGKPLDFIVKLQYTAESVIGHIAFVSREQEATFIEKMPESETAFIPTAFAANQDSSEQPKRLVLQEFSYEEDPNNPNVYLATVSIPADYGNYKVVTTINYKNKQLGSKEIEMVTVVDPEGYVYRRLGEDKLPVKNARVYLYWLDPKIRQYQLWPAKDYSQDNPQLTDSRGNYSFLVPEGTYYIQVESPSYLSYQSDPFQVKEGSGVRFNIELKPKYWWLKQFNWEVILLVLVMIVLTLNLLKYRIIGYIKKIINNFMVKNQK